MKVKLNEPAYYKGAHYDEGDEPIVNARVGGAWIQTGKANEIQYLAKRPFAHPSENRLTTVGEPIPIKSKTTAQDMIDKNLITPAYKTKEDKEATKVLKKSKDLTLKQVEEWVSLGRELDFKGDPRKGVEEYK